MAEGFVKSLLENRSFGFIRTKNGGEYFFHKDDYQGDWGILLQESMNSKIKVEFEIDQTSTRGPRAQFVRRVI